MTRTRTPTLSTHSIRNPVRPVQPPRKRSSKRTDHASKATAALKAAENLQNRINLNVDVDAFYDYKNTLKKTLSKKYNRTEAYIGKLLSNGAQYATTRAVSLRNAIIHDLSLKAKEAGEPSDLKTIRANLSKEEYEEIKEEMSEAERKRVIKQLNDHRELKHRGIRATNKALAADAMQNANRIGDVLIDLYERTGVRAIALFTRGHPDDPSVPHVVDSDETRAFFQEAFGCSVLDVLRKLELWSCTRDKAAKNGNDLDVVQKEVAELLTAGLRKVKNNKTLSMAYTNYREEIVHKLGVELAGWPSKIRMRRPSKMSAMDARSIRDKLRSGTICWVGLTRAQRDEVAEEIDQLRAQGALKQRKERSDKGLARGPRDNGDEDEESGDDDKSDSEEHSDDDDDSEEAPTRTRTQVSRVPINIPPTTVSTNSGTPTSSIADLIDAMPTSTYPALIGHDAALGAALAPFDPDALDLNNLNNINWDLAPPLSNFDWLNTDLNGATYAADVALATLQPQSYAANSHTANFAPTGLQPQLHTAVVSNPHPADLALAALQLIDPLAAVAMPPLPSSYLGEGGGRTPADEDFPLTLSTAAAGGANNAGGHNYTLFPAVANGGAGGVSSANTTVFSVSTNVVDRARKRANEDVEGAPAPKKARKEHSDKGATQASGDQETSDAGAGNAGANAPAPKQRKKRSDAGVKRKPTAGTDVPAAKQRKKRSDAGVKRGPRS
ncbi:hypothetical protein B0H19DRAFT_1246458 [Mycena capillaripes]|nr:hypothetical protein B0H19DRAFT_1246458 [Mycena capillaripes]